MHGDDTLRDSPSSGVRSIIGPCHGHGHGHEHSLLFIENVGNLVCPALWDLGEQAKVAAYADGGTCFVTCQWDDGGEMMLPYGSTQEALTALRSMGYGQ